MVSAFALGADFAEVAISAIGFPFWTAGLNENTHKHEAIRDRTILRHEKNRQPQSFLATGIAQGYLPGRAVSRILLRNGSTGVRPGHRREEATRAGHNVRGVAAAMSSALGSTALALCLAALATGLAGARITRIPPYPALVPKTDRGRQRHRRHPPSRRRSADRDLYRLGAASRARRRQ